MEDSVRPPKRPRALFLGLFALCAGIASLGIWPLLREPPARPNIVLIVADTLRQDYLGAYGFRGGISPAIDRLASESIVFENAISAAPWTPPAVASIFTSTYVQTHGLHGFRTNKVTVQDEAHKLVWKAPTRELALYDLASDPQETTDIAKERPEVVAQLREVAARLLERMEREPPPVRSPADLQETQIVDELRALSCRPSASGTGPCRSSRARR